jgi:hypothetical protein
MCCLLCKGAAGNPKPFRKADPAYYETKVMNRNTPAETVRYTIE